MHGASYSVHGNFILPFIKYGYSFLNCPLSAVTARYDVKILLFGDIAILYNLRISIFILILASDDTTNSYEILLISC